MALKLYKETGTNPSYQYVDDASPPGGYNETDVLADWDASAFPYIVQSGALTFVAHRVKLKASYDLIGAPTTADKEIASKWFVVELAVRDTVHSATEQEDNAAWMYDLLNTQTDRQEFIDHVAIDEVADVTDAMNNVVKTLTNSVMMYMNVSGTVELECSFHPNSSHHVKVNGNATINLDHVPENTVVFLMLEQDATGGYTITLPTFTNMDTQPVVTTVANKIDSVIIMKMHGDVHLHSYIKHTATF